MSSKDLIATPSGVYILKDDAGLVKVGVSYAGILRVHGCYSPRGVGRVGVLCTMFTPLAYRVESQAHKNLAAHRVSGEWFECTPFKALIAVADAWRIVVGREVVFRVACWNCDGFGADRNGVSCRECNDGLGSEVFAMEELAAARGVSMGDIANEALDQYVARSEIGHACNKRDDAR